MVANWESFIGTPRMLNWGVSGFRIRAFVCGGIGCARRAPDAFAAPSENNKADWVAA